MNSPEMTLWGIPYKHLKVVSQHAGTPPALVSLSHSPILITKSTQVIGKVNTCTENETAMAISIP